MDEVELRNIMYTAQLGIPSPLVIRYPRGRGVNPEWRLPFSKIETGIAQELKRGNRLALLTIGPVGNVVAGVLEEMGQPEALGHYNMRFAKPLDETRLKEVFEHYEHIITVEDGCIAGGFGSAVLEYANSNGYRPPIKILGVPDSFLGHGTVEELHAQAGIDAAAIRNHINSILHA